MTDLLMPRRKFLTGLFGLIAAPAVVKAANIMPVKVITPQWFANDGTGLVSMAHPVYEWKEIKLGYIITHREITDEIYAERMDLSTRALHEAMRQTREIYAANILNGAKT
jgi:hypothetical protein